MNLQASIAQHFIDNPNKVISATSLAKIFSKTTTQVQQALSNIRCEHRKNPTRSLWVTDLITIQPGAAWKYNAAEFIDQGSKKEPEPKTKYTHVGTTSSGDTIVIDAEGTLFKLVEL